MLVKELLRLTRKPIYTSEHTLRQHIARDRKKEKGDPPPSMLRVCQIERGSWQEVPCYTMRPFHWKGANGQKPRQDLGNKCVQYRLQKPCPNKENCVR